MEDNLHRARHSLHPKTTRSKDSIRLSLNKAGIGGISENPDSWSLTLPRKRQDDGNTHSRIFSTSLLVEESNPRSHRGKRAVSAMGFLSPRGTDWEPEDDESPWTPLSRSTSNAERQHDGLDSLQNVRPDCVDCSSHSSRNQFRHSRDGLRDKEGLSSSHSLHLDSQAPHEVKRARSSLQIRDLREQMQDLRGRISSLRQRTREDSLQRQSIQKLKSPSPFTVAPGWEENDTKDAEPSSMEASNCSTANVVEAGHELPIEISAFEPDTPDIDSTGDPFDNVSSAPVSPTLEPELDPYILDHGVVSPATPPRSSLLPPPGPRTPAHEDRPDAFNYEQYYLTYALPRHKQSVGSNPSTAENTPLKIHDPYSVNLRRNTQSSSSSASTTKALSPNVVHESLGSSPGTEEMFPSRALGNSQPSSLVKPVPTSQVRASDAPKALQQLTHPPHSIQRNASSTATSTNNLLHAAPTKSSHLRQNSGDSISTVNTFATATENAREQSEDGAAIADLGIGFSHPGWRAEQTTRNRSGTVTQNSLGNGHALSENTATGGSSALSIDTNVRDKRLSFEARTPTTSDSVSSQSPTSKDHPMQLPETSHLGETDKQLVRELLGALSRVCLDAQDLGDEENVYERKLLRRRLDGARRVLEGGSEGVLKS